MIERGKHRAAFCYIPFLAFFLGIKRWLLSTFDYITNQGKRFLCIYREEHVGARKMGVLSARFIL